MPPRPVWPFVLGGVAVLVVVLGLVGLLVGSSSDDDDDDGDGRGGAAQVVDPVVPGGSVITSGTQSITLPVGWVGGDLSAGADGFGAALFPDDPETADRIESAIGAVPRAITLIGFDGEQARAGDAFISTVNVLRDDSVPEGLDLDEIVRLQVRGLESVLRADVEEAGVIDLGGREVGRARADFGPATVLSYMVLVGSDTYVVTVTVNEFDDSVLAMADGIVASFTAG